MAFGVAPQPGGGAVHGGEDLLIGDVQGRVHLMLNEGTKSAHAFGKAQELTVDGKAIQVPHGDSHPIAVDWDGDKLLDLLDIRSPLEQSRRYSNGHVLRRRR